MCFFKHRSNNPTQGEGQGSLSSQTVPSWYRSVPGEVYKMWPKTDGVPEEPVFLKHCTSIDLEDEMLVSMLSAYGIPAVKMYPGMGGGFGVVVLGMSAEGCDVYVPASMHNDAEALLAGGDSDD